MAPPPPSKPSSMGINTILRKNDGSVQKSLRLDQLQHSPCRQIWGAVFFSPVECGIDVTSHETTTPHDVMRPPEMKDPSPSTKTMTSHFVLDSLLSTPQWTALQTSTVYQQGQILRTNIRLRLPSPIWKHQYYRQTTSNKRWLPSLKWIQRHYYRQQWCSNVYALFTKWSDTKQPEEPMKHCQQVTTSHSEETISVLRAMQRFNQVQISKLQMMEHQLHMNRWQSNGQHQMAEDLWPPWLPHHSHHHRW